MKELNNKVALITAASRGIGKESAKKLAENGATVYIAAIDMDEARETVREIEANGGRATCIYYDATDESTYHTMIKEVLGEAKKIDILVNNYGGTNVQKDLDIVGGDQEAFFQTIGQNILSVYLPARLIIPHMIQNGGGSIVNISSISSLLPDLARSAYGIAKSSINFLTKEIAVQYAKYNIRCNAVLPGLTKTKALENSMSEEFTAAFLKHVPLNRVGLPEDIAEAVLFFASGRSSFITGELLSVAGGYGIATPLYAQSIKS